MPVSFEVVLKKGNDGSILVYGNYKSGTAPLYVERVTVSEMDSTGNVVFNSVHHPNLYLDPSPGSYLLVCKQPCGTNIKAGQAKIYYSLIDKIGESPKTPL